MFVRGDRKACHKTSAATLEAEAEEGEDGDAAPVKKVLMIGDRQVGKTALLQQFMTSQYMGAAETSFGEFSPEDRPHQ